MSEQDVREQTSNLLDMLFKIWDDSYKAPEVKVEYGQQTINEFVTVVADEAIERGLIQEGERVRATD